MRQQHPYGPSGWNPPPMGGFPPPYDPANMPPPYPPPASASPTNSPTSDKWRCRPHGLRTVVYIAGALAVVFVCFALLFNDSRLTTAGLAAAIIAAVAWGREEGVRDAERYAIATAPRPTILYVGHPPESETDPETSPIPVVVDDAERAESDEHATAEVHAESSPDEFPDSPESLPPLHRILVAIFAAQPDGKKLSRGRLDIFVSVLRGSYGPQPRPTPSVARQETTDALESLTHSGVVTSSEDGLALSEKAREIVRGEWGDEFEQMVDKAAALKV